jgi:GNAT superfamily N-acetyltransferase
LSAADDVVALLERAEADAFADMYAAAPPEIGASARRAGGALVISARALPVVTFNRAFAFAAPPDAAVLDALLAMTPTLQLAPSAVNDAVRGRLTEGVHWAKVIRDAAAPAGVVTGLDVRELGPEAGQAFGRVVTTAFGMPPVAVPWLAALVGRDGWRTYGAYDGDEVVGAGALHLRGDVGWLGIGATLPSHRGRGGQRAVMARRIADAAAAGATTLATETGILPGQDNPSLRNMLRSGFEVAYERANWSA